MRFDFYPATWPCLLIGALMSGLQPASGQTVAMARQQPRTTLASPTVHNRRLADVLQELKARYQTDILFEDRTIADLIVTTDLPTSGSSLEKSLSQLLKPFNLRYRQVKPGTWIILTPKPVPVAGDSRFPATTATDQPLSEREILHSATTSSATGQVSSASEDSPVSGTVRATDNGEPLPGVSVVVKGTGRGTTTDASGRYQLSIPEQVAGPAILVFSFVGYLAQEVAIGNRPVIDIQLAPDDQTLSEVVVVGYGTQKKTDVTGSVASVKSKELNALPQTVLNP